ncbi:MAG: DUF362 domain-containing protein [Candidatus Pacebacteria bacterium]|nr:DUF362 domain-containing protein [Candidatus Paceibacterota bacterium]
MSLVSLVKNNQSYRGTLAVLSPLKKELETKIASLDRVVIKINFVVTHTKLATTPVETVKALIDFTKPFFKGQYLIAEEATSGKTPNAFEEYGFLDLALNDSQIELVDSGTVPGKKLTITHPRGKIPFSLATTYTEAPFIASVCRAKTHDTVVVTLGIKNLLVGAIQGGFSQRQKIHQGNNIHWIMKEIADYVYPDLVIIDGVEGMEGNGPISGTPIRAEWLAASLDALAADSLAANLMGFKNQDIGYFNLLKDANKGKLYPEDKIQVIGEKAESLIVPFKPHRSFARQRQWHQ